jgi:hypothetical protein
LIIFLNDVFESATNERQTVEMSVLSTIADVAAEVNSAFCNRIPPFVFIIARKKIPKFRSNPMNPAISTDPVTKRADVE